MWPALVPIISSVVGSAVTGMFNKASADANRDWQEEMSNTAHQREVADLKAAGLNPMLSAKLGGASSPGGSTATMPDLGSNVNNALVASRTKAEIQKIEQDTKTSQSQELLNQTNAIKQEAEVRLTLANAAQAEWEQSKKEYLAAHFDSWFVEGKELDARQALAVYNNLRSSDDYNTVRFLNEFAVQKGYSNYGSAVKSQEFLKELQTYMYQQLHFNEAQAKSDFYSTPYGREIAPYLSSAGGVSSLVGTAGAGLSLGRRIFGLGGK